MPYGSVSEETREYVEKRAGEGNVSIEKLELETSDEVTISIIWEGALDEEFDMAYSYAVNVADWIAELLYETYPDNSDWEILVSQNGDTIYRTDGESPF